MCVACVHVRRRAWKLGIVLVSVQRAEQSATAWLQRLLAWLELFEDRFSHKAQRGALRRYVQGVLSDSRRKSMESVWARLGDPGSYQALQHFITHAPWDAEQLWARLRAVVPERTGVMILDGTSFPNRAPPRSASRCSIAARWARSPIVRRRSRSRSGPGRAPGSWARSYICRKRG